MIMWPTSISQRLQYFALPDVYLRSKKFIDNFILLIPFKRTQIYDRWWPWWTPRTVALMKTNAHVFAFVLLTLLWLICIHSWPCCHLRAFPLNYLSHIFQKNYTHHYLTWLSFIHASTHWHLISDLSLSIPSFSDEYSLNIYITGTLPCRNHVKNMLTILSLKINSSLSKATLLFSSLLSMPMLRSMRRNTMRKLVTSFSFHQTATLLEVHAGHKAMFGHLNSPVLWRIQTLCP